MEIREHGNERSRIEKCGMTGWESELMGENGKQTAGS